ncbi:glycosyltransferase family 2 protein [Pontibacter sp. 13R65]|uniref:glycosyltransferase family 2 protein n=1 Tax=Pontibacter sp. 13R65 TaxID=3127458 RepID=UPI00301B9BDF
MATLSSNYYFPEVTLLITHYNRSSSIERLLSSFKELNCGFEEIIVSDDASKPEHLDRLKLLQEQFNFRLITTPVNGGLGNNINKGQDAVKTAYTIFVQDDFYPTSAFAENFKQALEIMKQESQWDLIRFYSFPWNKYPYLKPYKNNFSEMVFKKMPWYSDYLKFFFYSDHPHLRRKNFLDKFGRYEEKQHVYVTEWRMCLSIIRKKAKGLYYDGSEVLFEHKNSEDEPAAQREKHWGENWRKKKNPAVLALRAVYLKFRVIKNTFELIFSN